MLLHVSVCDYSIVHNDVLLPKVLTIVTLVSFKYKLPDDGHRPKHVGSFQCEF